MPRPMDGMTSIDLITGFLGAGKTTWIQGYADFCRRQGERVAVVENEFGAAGVDADYLRSRDLPVEQLVGGCICCTQKVGFHNVLVELAGKYDRLLVEPSGIFELDDFWDVARSPQVAQRARVQAVVVVADPFLLSALEGDARQVMARQLAGAAAVVVSKTQLLGPEMRDRVPEALRSLCPRLEEARVFGKPWDAWEDDDYLRLQTLRPPEPPHERLRVDHSTLFMSTTLRAEAVDRASLREILTQLMEGSCGRILRIKGRVALRDGGCLWVNCTAQDILLDEADPGEARLNIIGQGLQRRKLKALLQQ